MYELHEEGDPEFREFEWVERPSTYKEGWKVSKLVHRSSKYYFKIDFIEDLYTIVMSHGGQLRTIEKTVGNWSRVRYTYREWLTELRQELTTPDPWAVFGQQSELLATADSIDENRKFFSDELNQVSAGIAELKTYLIDVHSFQKDIIGPRLDYLEKASRRVGIKDWANILLPTIASIVAMAYVPPKVAREVLGFAGTIFYNVLHTKYLG